MTAAEFNLDATPHAELWALWEQHHKRPLKTAQHWFPEMPHGYIRAAAQLAAYACNKAVAMQCRERGEIQSAQVYELICDRIYKDLYPFARSW